jgi:O-antigen ligase
MQLERQAVTSSRYALRRHKVGAPWYTSLSAALVSDRARFAAFAGFVLLVALTGGGSRADIPWLIVLRPVAVLCFVYALFAAANGQFRAVRGPLAVVASVMLLALFQLVPLPATVWTLLPNREAVAEASRILGMGDLPRPLSLDPSRTWNTFFALFVPLAAIGLTAIQSPDYRRLVIPVLVAVGILSAVLGVLQALSGDRLHLYDISHRGFPVGLFANKNHQSIMLLWLILAVSWLAMRADPRRHSPSAVIGGVLAAILVLFPLLVLTGSRAGLMVSVPALLLSGWLLFHAPAMEKALKRAGSRAKALIGIVVAVMFLPLLFVFGMLGMSGRQTALSRLFELEAFEDLRWQHLPIFQQMALDFLPFGSGFGSFEKAFNLYEPPGMLTARYMNQAHNDLLQIIIEGGLPALAILLAGLTWLVGAIWQVFRSPRADDRKLAVFCGGSIALWLAAGLVDYPLRTPLAAMLVAILTAHLGALSTALRSAPDLRSNQGQRAEEF